MPRHRIQPRLPCTIAAILLLAIAAGAAADTPTKVIVDRARSDTLADLAAGGALLVAERGTYAVYEIPPASLRGDLRQEVIARPDFDTLALRRGAMTTRGAWVADATISPETNRDRRLKLVQFPAPPTDEELGLLRAAGARIVQYVPQNGYLIWTEDGRGARAVEGIRPGGRPLQFLGDFSAQHAVSPALDRDLGSAEVVAVAVQLFHAGKQTVRDVEVIERLAVDVITPPAFALNERYVNVRLSLRGNDIAAVAALDTVVSIEPYRAPELLGERQGQVLAGNVTPSGAAPAGSGYLAWLGSLGFSTDPADYPIIAIVDDGVDNGTTMPITGELYEMNDPLAPSRVAFSVTPPGAATTNPYGPAGHGHLNASIVAGYNNDIGPLVQDFFGFHYGLGIAPYGRIGNVRIFTPTFDFGTSNATMVTDYHSRGARISSNSWGSPNAATYDIFAQEYDALTRDAHPSIAGPQPMLFVFAAGNDGPSPATIGSPGTAKNVISVGASESFELEADEGSGCGDTLTDGNDARDMTSFSSRGPCADGRIKPDIIAPGTFIHGAASQPIFTGAGVCGAAGNDFVAPGLDALFPPGSAYTWSSGTSVATPAISAYAALVVEYLARVHGITNPSPALLKAFLVHGARHLTGAYANDDLPSPVQGFGIADMSRGFDLGATRFVRDQPVVFASSGDSTTFSGSIADAGEPVRIVLSWSDAPGPTFGGAFVNDLNLSVDIDGTVYKGNNFAGGVSQPGGTPDFRNNVEAVLLPAGSTGPATITIEAISIGGDAVPANADSTDQDFALVAYNFTDVASAGVASLDREVYNCSDTILLSVRDIDLLGTGSVPIDLATAGGDSETVLLTEAPASSGIFAASIDTAGGAVAMGNDLVETADGDVITLTYSDADDGTGNTAIVQDSATGDCISPSVSNVTVTSLGGRFATIDLDTDELTTLIISYGSDCASLTQTSPGIVTSTSHTVTLVDLVPLSDYFFAIEVTDAAGNVTLDDNAGACFSFSTLEPPEYFTELFDSGFDLAGSTLTLAPDGSNHFYTACRAPASGFPTTLTNAVTLELQDDASQRIDVGGGALVWLYGVPYGSFYVNSNGNLSFGVADSDFAPSLADHFELPRIAPLFDDLDPSSGGVVWWKQLADRVAVTFQGVPEFGSSANNSFQVEMFFDGTIRMTHLAVAANDALVGISRGTGLPIDFVESNLDLYGPCSASAGKATLDAPIYTCVDSVTARIEDVDLLGAGSATAVVAASGGDGETLSLLETPASSGIFVGVITTSSEPPAIEDGELQLGSSQTVTLTYQDLDDGTGNAAIRSFTARALCTDHFALYKHRVTRDGQRFHKFGPVVLTDELGGASYNILKPVSLGLPADKNSEGVNDAATHLEEYKIKAVKGTPQFDKVSEIRAVTQCGDLYLEAMRPTSLLVPSNVQPTSPAPPVSATEHDLDHFLCYRARVMKKLGDGTGVDGLADGLQVDVTDAFQTRRYDLKRVTRVCIPVAKSGTPVFLSNPDKGMPKPIEPAAIRNPDDRLVCYKATLAKKIIPQAGCGPLNAASSTPIDPPQEKHSKRADLHVNNQFGPGQRDTVRELELCLPSLETP
jgi:hypothetical protein